jgi:histidinol-phosphatase (PHP family)
MLLDYHLHTRFSDGRGELKDYAARAAELGLSEIGVADHCPWPQSNEKWHMAMGDLDAYVQMVEQTRREFPNLKVRLGLEVDFVPGAENFTKELAARHPWDYFLGSVHHVGDFVLDANPDIWQGVDVDKVWRDYFELWAQAACSGLFDSMAHLDLPKKFGFHPKADMTSVIERALAEAGKSGVAIEINTSGLRRPCKEIYPSRRYLEIARQLDFPITLGSDAHRPEELGANFAEAVDVARSVGYEQFCQFHRRSRELVALG